MLSAQVPAMITSTVVKVTTSFGGRAEGGAGHDSLYGGAGSDSMYGEEGCDLFFAEVWGRDVDSHIDGGSGGDIIFFPSLEAPGISSDVEIVDLKQGLLMRFKYVVASDIVTCSHGVGRETVGTKSG